MASSSNGVGVYPRCSDDTLYVGTSDLASRAACHNERRTRTTAERWTRAKKEALIAGDLALLKCL
jgi:predicted GIY-YIG superfamily endonuclease